MKNNNNSKILNFIFLNLNILEFNIIWYIKEMKKKKKRESDPKSVPNLINSKYIVYYYGFFWMVLISIVVFS